MLYHLIVVDDEEIIRRGISDYIKKAHDDIIIDSEFDDGAKAIDFLGKNHTDIVITDVKMSKKSGIDVAKYIYENKPDVKVVFLSGYKEFEYAQQAIAFNVTNYLSKPVKLKELNEALADLKKAINEENKAKENSKKYQDLMSFVLKDFFTDILFGSLQDENQIEKRAIEIGLSGEFLKNKCCVFQVELIDYHTWRYGKEDLYNTVFNLLRDVSRIDDFILISIEGNKLLFIAISLQFESIQEFNENLVKGFESIKSCAKDLLGIEFLFEVLFSCQTVLSLTDYSAFNYSISHNGILLEGKYVELATMIVAGDYEKGKELLHAMKQYTYNMDIIHTKEFITQMFSVVADKLSDRVVFPNTIINYDKLSTLDKRDEILNWCDDTLTKVFKYIAAKSCSMELLTINKAKEYINKNYSIDITLDDVANHVYLNPIYFSKFFKQQEGITFTEYLINVRMNAAIELFRMHKYKVYEISEMCGYRSSKYFAKAFKQFTGFTPTEYIRLSVD